MKDQYGEHKSLEYFRCLIMKQLEYDRIYDTWDVVHIMRESGLIPSIDYKDTCNLLRPLYKFGFLKIVGFETKFKLKCYQFVKVSELESVEIRIRWLTGYNDVWLWEKLVDGVLVDQRLNYF